MGVGVGAGAWEIAIRRRQGLGLGIIRNKQVQEFISMTHWGGVWIKAPEEELARSTMDLQVMEEDRNSARWLKDILNFQCRCVWKRRKKVVYCEPIFFFQRPSRCTRGREPCAMGRGNASHLGHEVWAGFTAQWTLMLLLQLEVNNSPHSAHSITFRLCERTHSRVHLCFSVDAARLRGTERYEPVMYSTWYTCSQSHQ